MSFITAVWTLLLCLLVIMGQGCQGKLYMTPASKEVEATEKSTAVLECSFGDDNATFFYPLFELFWLKNLKQGDLSPDARPDFAPANLIQRYFLHIAQESADIQNCETCSIKRQLDSSALSIQKVSLRDEGSYVCYMEQYSANQRVYSQINLIVKVPPEVSLRVSRFPVRKENLILTINCTVPRINPPASKLWLSVNGAEQGNTAVTGMKNTDGSSKQFVVLMSLPVPIVKEDVAVKCHVQWDGETFVESRSVPTRWAIAEPSQVKVAIQNKHCVVEWEKNLNADNITVCYNSHATNSERCVTETTETASHTFPALSEGIRYEISLYASNKYGNSARTETHTCLLGTFSHPRNVTVRQGAKLCVVSWRQNDHADSVTICHDTLQGESCHTETEQSFYEMKGLQKGLVYNIRLYASSKTKGKSPVTEGYTCKLVAPAADFAEDIPINPAKNTGQSKAQQARIAIGVSLSAFVILVVAVGLCIKSSKSKDNGKKTKFSLKKRKGASDSSIHVVEHSSSEEDSHHDTDAKRFKHFVANPSMKNFVNFISFGEPTPYPNLDILSEEDVQARRRTPYGSLPTTSTPAEVPKARRKPRAAAGSLPCDGFTQADEPAGPPIGSLPRDGAGPSRMRPVRTPQGSAPKDGSGLRRPKPPGTTTSSGTTSTDMPDPVIVSSSPKQQSPPGDQPVDNRGFEPPDQNAI